MTSPKLALHARPPRPTRGSGAVRRIAAIDIGSNSVRQIVADVSAEGSITVVDEMKAAPRLGADLDATGVIGSEAMERAVESIARMATLARQLGAERIEAVATSAVRDAENGSVFVARVRQEAGLQVRIIDGADEARLSYRSALAHFDLGVGRTVVMDIGGGSLELALAADGVLDDLLSLPFGALRLTERFLKDGATHKALARLRRDVRDALREVLPRRDWRGAQLIGSGGTFTNLAGIHLARRGMLAARNVHATAVPRVDVEHILDALAAMPANERREMAGLNPERADIIVAGIAVAAEVCARLDAREVLVSRYGIREGLLLETARVTPTVADPGVARERSVREFAERCHFEEPHALHVQKLALRLFDSFGARLVCVPEDRATLADAALLHDVGYHINYDRHHKHSYHLIAHAELLGITPAEQIVIANARAVAAGGEANPEAPKAARRGAMASRQNTIFSFTVFLGMIGTQHFFGLFESASGGVRALFYILMVAIAVVMELNALGKFGTEVGKPNTKIYDTHQAAIYAGLGLMVFVWLYYEIFLGKA